MKSETPLAARAAVRALTASKIPELRQEVADYISRLHRKTSIDEIAITSSGGRP